MKKKGELSQRGKKWSPRGWISVLLLIAMLTTTLLLPAGAAGSAFTDITDVQTQKNAAVLQMMGVVDGTSGAKFSPNGSLTRAQFCKMAVLVMGKGAEEPLYRNRTIFKDVLSTHWARGYINLAVSTKVGATEDSQGTPLIQGNNSLFAPDRNITYAEAVTILMRILGYTDADAGMSWPKGYLDLAANVELTKGMNLTSGQSITRAQAAQLFVSLLKTARKNSTPYYNELGGEKSDIVLLAGNVAADDGTLGALRASDGNVYKTVSGVVPPSLVGCRGILVTDTAGKAAAFIPTGEQKMVTVSSVQANWIIDEKNKKHTIPKETPAYTTTVSTTFEKAWVDIYGGMQVNLFYSATGRIDGVYLGTQSADTAMVAKQTSGGNPFIPLLDGDTGYQLYRDGSKAELSDIALYDVGTYDPSTKVLSVSSDKLSGVYENAWPNQESPSKITIMGAELPLLPVAMEEVAGFKIGASITALLTADGQVAGVLPTATARSVNVGIIEKVSNGEVTVNLLNGKTVSGECSTNLTKGELVQVASSGVKKLVVSRLSTSNAEGSFDIGGRKVGSTQLTASCRFFDKVGTSKPQEIKLDDLTQTTVSSGKIWYVHKTTSGKIDMIVFNDATGDLYEYGLLRAGEPQSGGSLNGSESYNSTIIVLNQENPAGGTAYLSGRSITKDQAGGLVASADGERAAGVVDLKAEQNIRRSSFTKRDEHTYVTLSTQVMRVADNVQCYNAVTKTWFADLADARAFSDNLTVYYDKSVTEGGKVRLVVAN